MKKIILLLIVGLLTINVFTFNIFATENDSENLEKEVIQQEQTNVNANEVNLEKIEEENKEEDNELMLQLKDYTETFDELDDYFELEVSKIEYDGQTHIPALLVKEDAPINLRYLVLSSFVEDSLVAKDVGNYTLVTYIAYRMDESNEDSFTKFEKLEHDFTIIPKEATTVVAEALTYNGKNQYPSKLFINYETLYKGIDYTVEDKPVESIYAYDETNTLVEYPLTVRFKNYTFEGNDTKVVTYTIDSRNLSNDTFYIEPLKYNGNDLTDDVEIYFTYASNTYKLSNDEYRCGGVDKTPIEPGNYTYTALFSDLFIYNNLRSFLDEESKTNTMDLDLIVNKAQLVFDFKALYYNGENQLPDISIKDEYGNTIDDSNYSTSNVNVLIDGVYQQCYSYSEVASYSVDVTFNKDIYSCYTYPEANQTDNEAIVRIGYRINKRLVDFDNFVETSFPLKGSLGILEAEFNWIKDDEDNVCLEYNGYNPFLFIDAGGYHPIPNAIFTYEYNDNQIVAEDIERYQIDYDPALPSDALKIGVGDYDLKISIDNDHYVTSDIGTFKVVPKTVTVNWTSTVVDIADKDQSPKCEIVGLVPIDELDFYYIDSDLKWHTVDRMSVAYSYYKYNDDGELVKIADAPLKYKFEEEGIYVAKAEYVVNSLGMRNPNYVIADDQYTQFIVVDHNSVDPSDESTIETGTINNVSKNIVNSIKLLAPSGNQLVEMISYLNSIGDETGKVLKNALDSNKNISIYLVTDSLNEDDIKKKGLILPNDNLIVLDFELFAFVEGDMNSYPIHDTGNYKVGIEIGLTNAQALALGYSESKCFYISRYHNSILPVNTQMSKPTSEGYGVSKLYKFNMSSNQFSEFCFYTGNDDIKEDYVSDRRVPNTQG